MLMLTKDAAGVIKGLTEAPGTGGLRISTSGGSGTALEAQLAPAPDPLDQVVEAEGARIFLAPGVPEALDDKVLDADLEGGEVRFAVLEQGQE